ncbi:MAG: efflux transporter outer membrane subunit, partial [Betaproteobacteria bacterium]
MTSPSRHFLLAALAVTAWLTGCASTAGLGPRDAPRDANGLASSQTLGAVSTPAAWPATDWWTSLDDPQLDALVLEALAGSPSLEVAAARTRQALSAAGAADAARGPRIDGTAASTRERFSRNGLVPPPLGGSTHTVNDLRATLGWEIDFWGGRRAAFDAALGAARAAEVDEYAARLALSTNVARAYVEFQHAYRQHDVAVATLAERERIFALTHDRYAAGLDSRLELKQAESALPATREEIVRFDERMTLARNEIAALLGQGPDRGRALARPALHAVATPAVPSTVPAELLGRRPDVVAQRWRVEAAARDIAAAKAQFYPNVNLVAFVGLQSLGVSHLLTAASGTFGAGPAVTLPIFDTGRLRASLAGRDADYDAAAAQYNATLAAALRDVVDQLASLRSIDAQRIEQARAAAALRDAYDLALLRYREGLGNYLQVLSAEQPLLTQQALDVDLQARQLDLTIGLVRALGGRRPHGTQRLRRGESVLVARRAAR